MVVGSVLYSLLNILGASKSLTPGQGLFMVKSITVRIFEPVSHCT
jgi:hypothetical protein